jgi:exonuclease VII large subunit
VEERFSMEESEELRQSHSEVAAILATLIAHRETERSAQIVNRNEQLLEDVIGQMLASLKDRAAAGRNRLLTIPDIRMIIKNMLGNNKNRFVMALTALDQLSPLAVLKRGYAIPLDGSDSVIRSVDDTGMGNLVRLLLSDGTLRCIVHAIEKGGLHGKEKND